MSIYLGKRTIQLANQKIPKIDTSKLIKSDGTVAMAGNLNLGNYAIDNLKTYPDGNKSATSKKYVDDECSKLLDLDANRQMAGDLDMNNNSIIGIHDISAGNSCPTKKFVKDEDKKRDAKITQNENQAHLNATRNLTMQNEINSLKNNPIYSHSGEFLYQNPVANVYKSPFNTPSGFPGSYFWLTNDYNDETTITILGINTDSDTTLPTTASISIEGIFYKKTGGHDTKVFLSGKNITSYRAGNQNSYYFSHPSFTMKIKDFHNNWAAWYKFQLKLAVPWSGNETKINFYVSYYS